MAGRAVAWGVGALAAAFLAAFSGCRGPEGSRWERHGSGEIWSQAFDQQLDHPEQLWPAAGLLVATPVLYAYDDELSEDAREHQYVTGSSTTGGDEIALALGAGAIGFGAVEACQGDDARSLEVGAESLVATEGVTEILKRATNRSRPEGSSSSSFPSGHTSFSFAAATFLARRIDDLSEGTASGLGYLLYAPATYVAINRVEEGRHWPSDVAAGAFLGIFLTNWIYNAHYGDTRAERPSIYAPEPRGVWRAGPAIEDGRLGLSLSFSF